MASAKEMEEAVQSGKTSPFPRAAAPRPDAATTSEGSLRRLLFLLGGVGVEFSGQRGRRGRRLHFLLKENVIDGDVLIVVNPVCVFVGRNGAAFDCGSTIKAFAVIVDQDRFVVRGNSPG